MAGRTAKGLREHNARQAKLAALRQAEQRRQNRIRLTIGAIGVVIAVVVALVAVGLTRGARPSGPAGATQASARVVKQLGSIPTAVYDAAGAPAKSPALPLNGVPTLTSDGKPEVLYIGAEYCPYCAAERWSVVAALSRFGTFSGLGQTQSSSVDYYPNTPTLSFEGAKYSSDYVAFQGYETEDRQRQPLDSLPPSVSRLFNKYGVAPYVPGADPSNGPSIPFIDFGGRYLISGASYDPQLLHGLTNAQVAAQVRQPNSQLGKAVLGTANTNDRDDLHPDPQPAQQRM